MRVLVEIGKGWDSEGRERHDNQEKMIIIYYKYTYMKITS